VRDCKRRLINSQSENRDKVVIIAKPYAIKFYKSKQWLGVREYVIRRDNYLCKVCGKPAEEVHHIIHLSPKNISNPILALGEDNLISVCRDCHFKIHREDIIKKVIESNKSRKQSETRQGYEFDKEGNIVQTTNNVYIVWGSPGSGKTTYVKSKMNIGDMVVDLDLIKQAISMQGKTQATDNLLDASIKIRDFIYTLIQNREVDTKTIWVVAGLPRREDRQKLKGYLKAELIYIDATIEQCIVRVKADTDRLDKELQVDIVNKWWKQYQR